ncbi:hypothetical protein CBM2585_A80289 [Cupriavidus taiwanensis]|nr:hypothetical protein CBM2585_A80289 [Cupriavidus taiwanensis]
MPLPRAVALACRVGADERPHRQGARYRDQAGGDGDGPAVGEAPQPGAGTCQGQPEPARQPRAVQGARRQQRLVGRGQVQARGRSQAKKDGQNLHGAMSDQRNINNNDSHLCVQAPARPTVVPAQAGTQRH